MIASTSTQGYRILDAALLRAATHTPDLFVAPCWPKVDEHDSVEPWCDWLAQVWSRPSVSAAVTIASPVLAARIEAVRAGHRPQASQVRRMALSLARYVVRMRGRATPFGLFAGVAPLLFGQDVMARWSDDTTLRLRADGRWLASVLTRLESCDAVRVQLTVRANDLALIRNERLVVPWQPHAGDPSRRTTAEISVRHSRAVRTVMRAAESPIRVADLREKLAAEFPNASAGAVDGIVAELVARGVLITSLRPPSTRTDALGHATCQLKAVEAGAAEQLTALLGQLHDIHAALTAASHTPHGSTTPHLGTLAESMFAVSRVAEQPMMVDQALGCTVVLPPQVADEAESAAAALLRLTPHPHGTPEWTNYRNRFLARYGAGATVRVRDLIDPTAGLGFPEHYENNVSSQSGPISRRDEYLLALAQQAALDGVQEVSLDGKFLDRLAADGTDPVRTVTHVELCAEVRAPTLASLTAGKFTLAVTGASRSAVALTGRFLDILPAGQRARMLREYTRLPTAVDGAIVAQLSFPPALPRTENVARTPQVLPELISLAEYRDPESSGITLDDLAVTSDSDRLYLVSLSRRQVVEPMVTNATALHTWPKMARLLFDLGRSHIATVSPFAWGSARCLPFLPRIRYGRAVLAPARWRVPADALPGPHAAQQGWIAAWEELRDRLRLSPCVSVGEADRRLTLNLDEPMDLALLRSHLNKVSRTDKAATVTEAPTAADFGWFGGRAHEIVIPLASTTPPAATPAILTRPGPLPVVGLDDAVLPGGLVVSAKLYGHPDGFDTILTKHLDALLSAWDGVPPRWWFLRYRDPAPHLRLRLHLNDRGEPGEDYGWAVRRVGRWADELRRRGLIGDLVLDTYHPEIARYGSGATLTAAETLFAADSAAALTQLAAHTASRQVPRPALTAASMVDLAAAMTGGLTAGMRWLLDHPQTEVPRVRLDRDLVHQTIRLTEPHRAARHAFPAGPQVLAAWQARRQAAETYAARVAADAWPDRTSVVASLLHLHHIRSCGIDPDCERLCQRLARAVALAWAAGQDTTVAGHR